MPHAPPQRKQQYQQCKHYEDFSLYFLHNVWLQQNPTMYLLLTAVAVSFINTALSTQPGIVPQEQHELEACLPLRRTRVRML